MDHEIRQHNIKSPVCKRHCAGVAFSDFNLFVHALNLRVLEERIRSIAAKSTAIPNIHTYHQPAVHTRRRSHGQDASSTAYIQDSLTPWNSVQKACCCTPPESIGFRSQS